MAFDVEGARAAGYSDAEIADHLAQQSKFNVAQARAAKYSDAEIIDHLTAPKGPAPAPALAPEDVPSVGKTLLIGAGHTFDKVLDGITQAWMVAHGDSDSTKAALKASVEDKARTYKPLQDARPVATAVGEALPSMIVPVGGAATALGTTAKLAASGAIPAVLEYGSPEERLKNAAAAATGAIVGGQVLPKAVALTGKAISGASRALVGEVSPEVAALYQKALALGIPVNAAQLSDSKFLKTLASTVEHVPLSGAAETHDIQQKAFNRAVSRTFGEDTPNVTRDVYDTAKTRIGGVFDRLSGQNELKVTPALMNEVNDVIMRTQNYTSPEVEKAVTNLASAMRSRLDTNTMTIPGSVYQAMDTEMGNLMKSGGEKSVYVGQLRDAFRKAMDHSISPADQAAWMEARGQYRNLKAVRDIVGKGGAEGDISPALLMGRLNATNSGKETMARGVRGDLGDLGTIGKQFVRETIPNSGTVQRAMAIGLLGGGGMMAGMSPQDAMWLMASGATSGRIVNKLINSPASGARAMAPAAETLSQILARVPTRAAQIAGSGTGMTISNLATR